MHLATLAAVLLQVTAADPRAAATTELGRGRRLWTEDDLGGALAALDRAVALDPELAGPYVFRALIKSEQKDQAGARADFDRAVALAPGDKEARRHYCQDLIDWGELDAAEAQCKAALAIDPDYADAVYLAAKIRLRREDLGGAIPLYERHARLAPRGDAHHALGLIYLQQGDDARAAAELEQDLAVDPTCYEARVNVAAILLERGELARAVEQYRISLEHHPADARALSGLGRAYLGLGDHELAVGTLRAALDLSPNDREVAGALARARLALRLRLGWPLAIPPAAIAAGLLAWALLLRRRVKATSP